jgi:hypothetical protein
VGSVVLEASVVSVVLEALVVLEEWVESVVWVE